MSNPVSLSVHGPVAVITMDKPPVNSLGAALRAGIADALDQANANVAVRAIVLTGTARAFSAGADVTEFGTPNAAREPNLRVVIAMLEDSPKPVICAIAGQCLGGGLELAMGCHFRVASADANLGLPEVKLGLLPGAGGTQRLPRLVGLETALNMVIGGSPVAAAKLAGTSLVDQIVDGVKKVIAEVQGEVSAVENIGKKDFVRVTDKRLTGAAYVHINFSAPADAPAHLRERLRLNGSVYRTFIQSA